MSKIQKEILLKEISEWSTEDVVALLTKNKLSECCSAITKRQIDGEELLHLSVGKLNLWKDLTQALRWDLCRFVENLLIDPKQYCPEEIRPNSPISDHFDEDSASDSWDTDFEEGDGPSRSTGEYSLHNSEDHDDSSDMYGNGNIARPPPRVNPIIPGNKIKKKVEDNANDNDDDNEGIYVNVSGMVEQLKGELLQRKLKEKPSLYPKPNVTAKKPNVIKNFMKKPNMVVSPPKKPNVIETPMKEEAEIPPRQVLRPTMNNYGKLTQNLESIEKIEAAKIAQAKKILSPPKPKITTPIMPAPDESRFKKLAKLPNLPQPPSTFPRMKDTKFTNDTSSEKGDDSDEYNYEPINARKIVNKQSHSSESLVSGRSDNTHHSPTSSDSIDDSQDFYERIPETHDSPVEYEKPLFKFRSAPRPTFTGSMPKRPVDRTTATVPITGRQPSRPLPLLPINGQKPDKPVEIPDKNFDGPSYTEKPWFHNVGRDEAIAMIEGGSSRFSHGPPDGYFLIRPSNANMNQPWTLVLWYKKKVYNIAVRKRPDSKYALGKVKPGELPFNSIEEMVNHYKSNELVLTSGNGDVAVGTTRFTETPTRQSRND